MASEDVWTRSGIHGERNLHAHANEPSMVARGDLADSQVASLYVYVYTALGVLWSVYIHVY